MAYISNTCSFEDWMTESESEGHTFPSPELMLVAQEMLDQGYAPEEINEETIAYYLNH